MSMPSLENIPWPKVTMSEVCDLHYGKALTASKRNPGCVPVYGSNGIAGWHDTPLRSGRTVILGRKGQGPLGVEWRDGPFWVIDTAYYTTFDERMDPRFFYYFVDLMGLNHLKDGTSNPSLTRDIFGMQEIPLPPISEQREVAASLQTLDDKIELNRKMAATLEEMARALYRSWFVDFDPVHAKAQGRAPAHMDPTTAALFPDRFGEDGLPEGWQWEAIGQHVNLQRGLSYKGKFLATEETGLPLHNLNSVKRNGGYSDDGLKFYAGDFKERHFVQPGDLIVANTDLTMNEVVIGYPAIVPKRYGPNGLFSQHLFKVEPKPNSHLTREWLYLGIASTWIGRKIRAFANGTTVNMLPKDAFEIPNISIPTASVVEKFDELVKPMFEQQENLREANQTLATLRDTLLPKLMSGELRVGEAEKQIEEVV